jgi:predicted signal transduction protein with EAL and GGDEF domain
MAQLEDILVLSQLASRFRLACDKLIARRLRPSDEFAILIEVFARELQLVWYTNIGRILHEPTDMDLDSIVRRRKFIARIGIAMAEHSGTR